MPFVEGESLTWLGALARSTETERGASVRICTSGMFAA